MHIQTWIFRHFFVFELAAYTRQTDKRTKFIMWTIRTLDGSQLSADESRQDRVAAAGSKHNITMLGSCAPAMQLSLSRYCDCQWSCTSTRGDHFVGSGPWKARFKELHNWFLLAAPTSSHPAVAWQRIGSNSCACFCDITNWLLQRYLCRSSEDNHEYATSAQRRHPSSQRHKEVWLWSVDTPA